LGSALSVLDCINFGASVSLRGVFRCGSTISVQNKVEFTKADTYIVYSTTNDQLELYINEKRAFSAYEQSATAGGVLHGVWFSDNLVHISDRSLKTSIRPLVEMLDTRASGAGSREGGAEWVLRELRPVSYKFKAGSEAKMHRFGFIANEIAQTIPQVIREKPNGGVMGLVYQDLIAVLTAALQSVQRRLEDTSHNTRLLHERLELVETSLLRQEQAMARYAESTQSRYQALEGMLKRLFKKRRKHQRRTPGTLLQRRTA